MQTLDYKKPTDRELLQSIVHTVDRVELGQEKLREDVFENLGRMSGHIVRVENRLDHVENRLGHIENRLDHIDGRMGNVEQEVKVLTETIGDFHASLDFRVRALEER